MNQSFWQELPAVTSFEALFDKCNYSQVPASWYLFVADIQGSTQAIEAGRYKDVNLIGALSLVAVLNACKEIEIPYVFGGDGATILVPANYYQLCLGALLATKHRAQENFSINLRVGAVAVARLYAQDLRLNIVKLRVSKDYEQAIFLGGGLSLAENWIKNSPELCFDLPKQLPEANFDGLECRWKDIPSSKEETISLLIQAKDSQFYPQILKRLDEIIGNHSARHPVAMSKLSLSFSHQQLFFEVNAKYTGLERYIQLAGVWLKNFFGWFLIYYGGRFQKWPWGGYKRQVQMTTDAEKFDDMLRMVCCVTSSQRRALELYLQQEQQVARLYYGLHISDRALMTCLVFQRHGKQVHFIDAADGGYALAAKMLKRQNKPSNR